MAYLLDANVFLPDDVLAPWAQGLPAGFWVQPDLQTMTALPTVSDWANGAGYDQAAVADFLDKADYYLIAEALAHDHVVVTLEKSSPQARKRIPIPDACIALDVDYESPHRMLKNENPVFVLGP